MVGRGTCLLERAKLQSIKAMADYCSRVPKITCEKCRKLIYENSSIPSSKSIKRKKITNSRERTGRKPGAQPGHAHHPRKKQIPTQIINLAPPSEITEDPDFRPTGKTIVKQLIGVHMVMDVTEYHAEVFRNAKTGELRHAAFPDGVVNDVNYDGTVKALLFYLNVECAVSIDKCCRFLNDLTGGKLQRSGWDGTALPFCAPHTRR